MFLTAYFLPVNAFSMTNNGVKEEWEELCLRDEKAVRRNSSAHEELRHSGAARDMKLSSVSSANPLRTLVRLYWHRACSRSARRVETSKREQRIKMALTISDVKPRTVRTRKTKLQQRDELIVDHLPLVKYLAQRMVTKLPPSVEVNDLVSAGVLGLMDAVEKYEAERGVKFKTYAEQRIRGAMIDSLRSMDWAPRSLRRKERALEKAYATVEQTKGRTASDDEVARELNLDIEELHRWLTDLNGVSLGGFNNCGSDEDSQAEPTDLLQYVPDREENIPYYIFEREELREQLSAAIDNLPEKERMVISLYYYEELTMKEIGTVLGVNESRISQLHTKAVLRLKGRLRWMGQQQGRPLSRKAS